MGRRRSVHFHPIWIWLCAKKTNKWFNHILWWLGEFNHRNFKLIRSTYLDAGERGEMRITAKWPNHSVWLFLQFWVQLFVHTHTTLARVLMQTQWFSFVIRISWAISTITHQHSPHTQPQQQQQQQLTSVRETNFHSAMQHRLLFSCYLAAKRNAHRIGYTEIVDFHFFVYLPLLIR